jgi:hypothetical protein
MSITATVENDTIKLPMHVPDGTTVEIQLPEEEPELSPAEKLEAFRELQRRLALTPEKAEEWKRIIREGRR